VTTLSRVLSATAQLRRDTSKLRFGAPVTHVYNPLEYAGKPHRIYLERFVTGPRRVVFLGMNPGPFGMAQTGVPFGEVELVRDWLGIEAPVGRPKREHPKRPITGFECHRREVSGQRVWGAIRDRYGTPEKFFRHHFIVNYCPLIFLEESGRNRTPDKLPAQEREPLFAVCDRHLRRILRVLEAEWVIGIGAFAANRARAALPESQQVGVILHPSPANPRANRDWRGTVTGQLEELGICRPKRR
jgi:single-strand selective monofunctional uracil DNA glycosylase